MNELRKDKEMGYAEGKEEVAHGEEGNDTEEVEKGERMGKRWDGGLGRKKGGGRGRRICKGDMVEEELRE